MLFFTIKDSKLYVPVVTLSAKDNHKLSKLLRKGFERSSYWSEYKTKSENRNTKNEYRVIFSNQVLLELIDYLFQFIQINMAILKDLILEDVIYQKK